MGSYGLFLIEDDPARIRRVGVVAVARHPCATAAAKLIVPRLLGMVLTHPPEAETKLTVLVHQRTWRTGGDLSSFCNSRSAW